MKSTPSKPLEPADSKEVLLLRDIGLEKAVSFSTVEPAARPLRIEPFHPKP